MDLCSNNSILQTRLFLKLCLHVSCDELHFLRALLPIFHFVFEVMMMSSRIEVACFVCHAIHSYSKIVLNKFCTPFSYLMFFFIIFAENAQIRTVEANLGFGSFKTPIFCGIRPKWRKSNVLWERELANSIKSNLESWKQQQPKWQELFNDTDNSYDLIVNFGIFDKIPVLLSNYYLEKSTIKSHSIPIAFISANFAALAKQNGRNLSTNRHPLWIWECQLWYFWQDSGAFVKPLSGKVHHPKP